VPYPGIMKVTRCASAPKACRRMPRRASRPSSRTSKILRQSRRFDALVGDAEDEGLHVRSCLVAGAVATRRAALPERRRAARPELPRRGGLFLCDRSRFLCDLAGPSQGWMTSPTEIEPFWLHERTGFLYQELEARFVGKPSRHGLTVPVKARSLPLVLVDGSVWPRLLSCSESSTVESRRLRRCR
jgi:hypothetical protein